MLLLPIGRDDSEIRRHAWVSYVVIALNIFAFIAVETAQRNAANEINAAWTAAVSYLVQHPYLTVPPQMTQIVGPRGEQYLAQARKALPPTAVAVKAKQQEKLDSMAVYASSITRELPTHRYGYIPAEGGKMRLVTHMFVHAGFLHLFGNLLFFFLSGPFVEDVFGRPLFAALYVLGGFAAALTYGAQHVAGEIPLVGASGAIAAVMGAYLVRFLRSKIEFLFVPFLFRPTLHFRFFMPAFVVLPLWFVQQFLEMGSETSSGAGVAFSAHVGGFVFGVVVALLVKVFQFEEKVVAPVVVKQTTWAMDDRIVAALQAQKLGDHESALRDVAAVLRDDPKNIDALRIGVDAATASENAPAIDAYGTRLLNRYIDEKQNELASQLVHEVTMDAAVSLPKFLPRAAMFAERSGDADLAMMLYERTVAADPNAPSAVASLVKIGTMLRTRGDLDGAREIFRRARFHPACNADWAPTIDARLAQLGASAEPQGETPW